MEKAFIIDIDGTAIDVSARAAEALKEAGTTNREFWDIMFDPEMLKLDTPIPGVKECLQELAKKGKIFYVSGRRTTVQKVTEDQIKDFGYPEGIVILRKKGVKTKNFKIETIKRLKTSYNVVCGVGDSPEDIEAYTETDIPEKVLVISNIPWVDCPCRKGD
jgi:predicted secreted acid phosphatase